MVIYETINLINGKRYIGQDANDNPNYLGSGKNLKKAIEKYGRENFQKIILERCNSREKLNEREQHWIAITNAQKSNKYYNIVRGGTGGDNWEGRRDTPEYQAFCTKMKKINNDSIHIRTKDGHSDTTKENQRKAAKGRYTLYWFVERYGEINGKLKYEERNKSLMYRNVSPIDITKFERITKEVLSELILNNHNATAIERHFNISCKRLRTMLKKYFGDTNVIRIQRLLQ